MSNFKVAVTVLQKNNPIPVWNKVHLGLKGDSRNLRDLQSQFELVKSDVNKDLNKKSIPFKSVDIFIDIL